LKELERIERLKIALRQATQGRGIGAAVVEVFRRSKEQGEYEAARQILLGIPVRESVSPMATNNREAGFDLLRYIVFEARVNSVEAGRKAEKLTSYFERWAEMKQKRSLEQKAMEVRAHMISAILGAVLAMISSLAPILASFQFLATPGPTPPSSLPYFGFAFTVTSASFLGMFSAPRRPYVEPLISSLTYVVTYFLIAPLVVFSVPSL
jgi:hypothetical protein